MKERNKERKNERMNERMNEIPSEIELVILDGELEILEEEDE